MNAQNVAEYFMHPSIAVSADFAVGGYPSEALALALRSELQRPGA
jgi:hypothetical protein